MNLPLYDMLVVFLTAGLLLIIIGIVGTIVDHNHHKRSAR